MSGPRHRRSAAGSPLDLLALAESVAAAGIVAAPAPTVDASQLRDARGYRRTAVTMPGHFNGREPANKGKRYPPDPPPVEECMAMLNACAGDLSGRRLYAALVLMWQGALRAFEALALTEADLEDPPAGRLHIRHGKGDKQATITMAWAWPFIAEWRAMRRDLPNPDGRLLCIVRGPTTGREWAHSNLNRELKRHAWAAEAYRNGVPLRTIQLHLRHENIGITDTYLRGLGLDESRDHVYQLAVPMVPATALLDLPSTRRELAHV